eukprot:gene6841-8171_t
MSAQGAIEIEGFDDDFEEENFVGDEGRDRYEEEEEAADELQEPEQPDIETLVQESIEERERLEASNAVLQRKLFTIFSNRKSTEVRDAQGKLQTEGQDTRYQQALAQWAEQLEEKQRIQRHFETQTFDMKARLEERMTRANDIRNAFRNFKLEVARSSENSRTGKPIPERVIQEKMQQELKKEAEVERVRLKNIQLRNQMKKLEAHLKAKEELAEGLHLIDFEQLKIENQSLNEKIEERNEELLKLRKKTTTTVQVLTHLKEKLQFVQKENEVLQQALEALEVELADKRDSLQKQKHDRDTLRTDNTRIKAQSGIVTHPQLLDDIEVQKEKREVVADHPLVVTLRDTESVQALGERLQGVKRILVVGNGGIALELVYGVQQGEGVSKKEGWTAHVGGVRPGAAVGPEWAGLLRQQAQGALGTRAADRSAAPRGGEQRRGELTLAMDSELVEITTERPAGAGSGKEIEKAEDGAVVVDRQMRTSAADVYAAGDACSLGWDDKSAFFFQMRLWTQARLQGRYAAHCMAGVTDQLAL